MRVDRIRLQNFKCYGETDLTLDAGVTVVHGVNGSGKSTLLEAIFFALYGAKALDDRTLSDVVTIGEDETEVELWFTHGGASYHVERRVTRRAERATTTKCVLSGPGEPVEGARDVRDSITRKLRMDADAFVNCAYVRQGEVNKLIHASPSDRQDVIDDLLQLGALEEYRERASDARLAVKTVLDGQREVLEDVRARIEEKEAAALHDRLNDLETRRRELAETIERYESQREQARETLETAADVLDRYEETQAEIEALEADVEDLRSKIGDTEREREAVTEEIRELEAERAELEAERAELASERAELLEGVDSDDGETGSEEPPVEARIEAVESRDEALRDDLEEVRVAIERAQDERERLLEKAAELETEATEARERADELDEQVSADEAATEERGEKIDDLDAEIAERRDAFDDVPIVFGEAASHLERLESEGDDLAGEIGDVRAEKRSVEAAIEEGEALLEAGKCPECGQPVDESPHVDVLDEKRKTLSKLDDRLSSLEDERSDREERIERVESLRETERRVERLEENRDAVERLLEEKQATIADRRERREEVLETAHDRAQSAEERREAAEERGAEVTDRREELGEINARRTNVREALTSLRRIAEIRDERSRIESEIETLRERREDWETMNGERREQLSEKRERKRELEAEFDEERIESAREDESRAETYLEQVEPKLEELEERRGEVRGTIGSVEEKIGEAERLRERASSLEDRCESLQSLLGEARTLESTYGDLRAELRQRNVETLERLLNETFDLIYRNDAYAGIDLDGEYRLTVYQKDGEPLDPEQLSGGERALFNLSLRCAIYRLLAEGVEGAAPMPPLILDEPTVFLDSGHVTQLVSLVESMRTIGVEQIVLVSHDEELVGAADDLVHVEKDATSNRSQIERGPTPEPAPINPE